jgi:hypothetical protein
VPALILFSSVFHVSPEFISSIEGFKLKFCTNYSTVSRAAVCPSHGLITLMSRHYLNSLNFAAQTKIFF